MLKAHDHSSSTSWFRYALSGAPAIVAQLACGFLMFAISLHTSEAHAYTNAEIDAAAELARNVGIATTISADVFAGRNNNTPESTAVQALLIDELKLLGSGLNSSQIGDAAYKQTFSTTQIGTNLLAVIPGSSLPGEYIMIGAHFDHFGPVGPDIFNGATDNAGGVAIVLAAGAAINALPTPPQRSVILALWDAEEDGLVGSEFFSNNPLVPLSSIKSYVNLDIHGQNLLPSLRNVTFALASESGGLTQQLLLFSAKQGSSLDLRGLSRLFGQDRSDHASFIDDGVPVVFLSDAPGSCYHTFGDDAAALDLNKLADEGEFAFRLLVTLTEAAVPAVFQMTGLFQAVYQDAVVMLDVIDLAIDDLLLFPPADQTLIMNQQAIVQGIVNAGAGAFMNSDIISVAVAADALLTAVANLPCDGFVLHHVPTASLPSRGAIVVLVMALGALFARRVARVI